MTQVNMQQVKELRDRTQAGLNDCRAALVEAEGDMEKAVENILKKGLAKSAKRAGAVAAEGAVVARVSADGKSGALVEVNIQTDFAARNADFQAFADSVAGVALKAPAGADLLTQPHPSGGTVEDVRAALVGRLGENILVRRWERMDVSGAGRVHAYVHMGGKIGALISVQASADAVAGSAGVAQFLDETCMHIAAMAPIALSRDDVPADARAKQAEIFAGQLAEEGKVPEARRAQVVEGKIAKWLKEVCLLEQPAVTNGEKTIDQLRADAGAAAGGEVTVLKFVRFERGEGIARPTEDFAAEVAKMAT